MHVLLKILHASRQLHHHSLIEFPMSVFNFLLIAEMLLRNNLHFVHSADKSQLYLIVLLCSCRSLESIFLQTNSAMNQQRIFS